METACIRRSKSMLFSGNRHSGNVFLPTQLVCELLTSLILLRNSAAWFQQVRGLYTAETSLKSSGSVAVSIQCFTDGWFHATIDGCRSSQVTFSLVRHARCQVTGTGLPMLGLALGRQAEPLLGPFMSLLLRHLVISSNKELERMSNHLF